MIFVPLRQTLLSQEIKRTSASFPTVILKTSRYLSSGRWVR